MVGKATGHEKGDGRGKKEETGQGQEEWAQEEE